MVMLKQSGQANRQMMRFASDEVMTTARATVEMTGCSSPAAVAEAAEQVRACVVRSGDLELDCNGNPGIRSAGR